jgi:hypothetical protein
MEGTSREYSVKVERRLLLLYMEGTSREYSVMVERRLLLLYIHGTFSVS